MTARGYFGLTLIKFAFSLVIILPIYSPYMRVLSFYI
jgi:hypothetical protein